jgi:hypothetical protein
MKEGRSGAEMLAMAQEYHETRARVAFATQFAASTSSEQQPRDGGMVKSRSQPAGLVRRAAAGMAATAAVAAAARAAQQRPLDGRLHDPPPPQSINSLTFRPISAEARRLFRVPTQYRMPVHDMTEHNERLFKDYNIFGHAPPGPRFVC